MSRVAKWAKLINKQLYDVGRHAGNPRAIAALQGLQEAGAP
jgi:hypothetical protein